MSTPRHANDRQLSASLSSRERATPGDEEDIVSHPCPGMRCRSMGGGAEAERSLRRPQLGLRAAARRNIISAASATCASVD